MEMVTAVITTCKREKNIVKRAIDSIEKQTYKNIEIIVVDDSPDSFIDRNSIEEMTRNYGNIKYIKHKVSKGACFARNTGLENANGEYIAYLDDDDEWLPQKIELQLSKFNGDNNTALVYCGRLFFDDRTGKTRPPKMPFYGGMIYKELLVKNFIGSTSFPLIRTSALREIGGFDVSMLSAQDYDVWLRLAEKYEFKYIDKPLALYHIHNNDRISTNSEKVVAGLERIIEKNKIYLNNHKDILNLRYLNMAYIYTKNKEYKRAENTWILAVKCCPTNVIYNLSGLINMFKAFAQNILIKKS